MRNYLERYREKYRNCIAKREASITPQWRFKICLGLYASIFPAPILWTLGIIVGALIGIPAGFSAAVAYFVGAFALIFYLA